MTTARDSVPDRLAIGRLMDAIPLAAVDALVAAACGRSEDA